MLTTSVIKVKRHLTFTLSVGLQTIMTFEVENEGQNGLHLIAWTMYLLVNKHVENDNTANHHLYYCSATGIICNISLFENFTSQQITFISI